MKVALFIPCYVDAFFPEVGIATLELLERLGCEVDYPLDQTCCGQPMANSGCQKDARGTEALFARELRRLRPHRHAVGQLRPPCARAFDGDPADRRRCRRSGATPMSWSSSCTTFSRCASSRGPSFRTRSACTIGLPTLRELRTAKASEIDEPAFSKPLDAAARGEGHRIRDSRSAPDECCGFGGTFSVFEEPVSAKMGYDKVADHQQAGAEYIVSARHVVPDAPEGLRGAAGPTCR